MPPNNRKQAMLPASAEVIDNPIGTACGFAVNIGRARFFFTPGVPRELRRMLEEQIIPRLLKSGGITGVTRLKRFHSYGIGESHADCCWRHRGLRQTAASSSASARTTRSSRPSSPCAATTWTTSAQLAPVEAEVRKRLGNFILAEDDQTLEGVVLQTLLERGHTLSTAETFTGGQIAARLAPLPGAEKVFRRGIVARDPGRARHQRRVDRGRRSRWRADAAPGEQAPATRSRC